MDSYEPGRSGHAEWARLKAATPSRRWCGRARGRNDFEDQLGCLAIEGNWGGQRQPRTVVPVRAGAELAPFTLKHPLS